MKLRHFPMLVLILSLCCCSKTGEPTKKGDTIRVEASSQGDPSGKFKDFRADYTGSLDGKYAIVLQLAVVQGQLTGRYFYKSAGTDIPLRGTVDEHGNLRAEERDSKGTVTGIFEATVSEVSIIGKWFPPDRKKSLDLYAEKTEASYDAWQLVARTMKEHNFIEYRSPVSITIGLAGKPGYFTWKHPATWEVSGKGMTENCMGFYDRVDDQAWVMLYHTTTEKKLPEDALHEIYSHKILNSNEDALYSMYDGKVGDRLISESRFMDHQFSGTFAWTKEWDDDSDWMCVMYVLVHPDPHVDFFTGKEKSTYPVSVVLGNASRKNLDSKRAIFDAVAASAKFSYEVSP